MALDEHELWSAGFMSAMGSFSAVRSGPGMMAVRYSLSSSNKREAILRFADLADVNVALVKLKGKKANGTDDIIQYKITMQGDPLAALVERLWEGLTNDRKREYRKALNAIPDSAPARSTPKVVEEKLETVEGGATPRLI